MTAAEVAVRRDPEERCPPRGHETLRADLQWQEQGLLLACAHRVWAFQTGQHSAGSWAWFLGCLSLSTC